MKQISFEVRDWCGIMPSSISLKNAYRDRKPKPGEETFKVPHSFTFMAREGLCAQLIIVNEMC